jgi:hypothetical protein
VTDNSTEQLDEAALDEALTRQVQAERDLSRRLDAFVGKWVAVRDHDVAASAETLDELLDIIDPDSVEAVFEVNERVGAVAFY